MREMWRKH